MIQTEHSFRWQLKNSNNATEHDKVPKPLSSKEATGLFRTQAGNSTALFASRSCEIKGYTDSAVVPSAKVIVCNWESLSL